MYQSQPNLSVPYPRLVTLALCFPVFLAASPGSADTPPGWINSGNTSAYTTAAGDLELTASWLRVNDTIDFLDVREDLIAGNRRLVGDSGDLEGYRLEAHYGFTEWLSVHFRQQRQDLTVDLGEISSVNVLAIDGELETTARELGLKWTFYIADQLNRDDAITAASLEVSAFDNDSASFDVLTDQISLGNLTVNFADPRTFSVLDLQDDGWQARLLYTTPVFGSVIGSAWAGYKDSDARSGTDSDIEAETVARFFRQRFSLEESYWLAGASLNFRLRPRLPVTLAYEYLKTRNSTFSRDPVQAPSGLPGFLTGGGAQDSRNHTVTAQATYWLSPALHLSLSGRYFSNQFLGVLPHYNNPLSGSFADDPYGYLGVSLGYSLRFP